MGIVSISVSRSVGPFVWLEDRGQQESGRRVGSCGLGFSSAQSAVELNPQHLIVACMWSMTLEYRESGSVQLYLVTASRNSREAAFRKSALKAKASPAIVNSSARITVTMIPKVRRMQWDSTRAPQHPRKAIRKIRNPSTITL